MRRLMLSRMAKAVVVLVAPAAIAGGAIAATTGPGPADPTANSARPIASPDSEQVAAFGVLREARNADDDLPDKAAATVARGSGPAVGANPQLAHRTTTALPGVSLHVIPGQGWMCWVDSDGMGACNTTAEARRGYLVGLTHVPEGYKLRGVLPDGVKAVTVVGDKESTDVPVERNGWAAAVTFAPTAVRYTDAGGEHVVPVFVPGS
jgi:hypothetical protein